MEPGVGHEDPSGCLSAQDDSMILSSMTAVGVFFWQRAPATPGDLDAGGMPLMHNDLSYRAQQLGQYLKNKAVKLFSSKYESTQKRRKHRFPTWQFLEILPTLLHNFSSLGSSSVSLSVPSLI